MNKRLYLDDPSFKSAAKLILPLIIVVLCFIAFAQTQSVSPQGMRTDLMRNADYVGLYGKKQTFLLHDDVLTKGGYEIAKVQ